MHEESRVWLKNEFITECQVQTAEAEITSCPVRAYKLWREILIGILFVTTITCVTLFLAQQWSGYKKIDTSGFEKGFFQNKKAVVAGCARNVAKFLQGTLAKMIELGFLFEDFRVIIFENDSS